MTETPLTEALVRSHIKAEPIAPLRKFSPTADLVGSVFPANRRG